MTRLALFGASLLVAETVVTGCSQSGKSRRPAQKAGP
jgi:hypothetical protein